jgi:hypothetical protein
VAAARAARAAIGRSLQIAAGAVDVTAAVFHDYSGFENLDRLFSWSTHIDHARLAYLEAHARQEPRNDAPDGIRDPAAVL